ncbi:MAG: transcription/translation regulatory transformer protein RfaH [Gammaproteobacteria bacterium]|nr:transcription/translation regulatory transformer protein RfaH [Gammaproteobacteria bacterium]
MDRWHLIYTKPRQEALAHINLQKQHFESFLPLVTIEKIFRGKRVLNKEPMFPRYLFVRIKGDRQQNWSPIRSTRGVSQLVTFGGQLAILDDEVMANLIERLDEDPLLEAFSEGDIVEIVDGPFGGLEAVFRTFSAEGRATLLLEFMAKKVNAKFELGQFKRVA